MKLPMSCRSLMVHIVLLSLILALMPVGAHSAPTRNSLPILIVGVGELPHTLNPLVDPTLRTADVTDAVFDGLLTTDTHDALKPDLAAHYTISPDGLRYTFSLDPRAHWQDGEAVTAGDVLFTARLMRDSHFPALNRFGFGNILSLSSDGPLTVTAMLRAPFGPFLRAFATTPILPSHVLSPLPINQVATYAAFNQHPIGSGPFAVTEFQAGDHLTLSANSTYFRGSPHVGQIVLRAEPSTKAALAALRSGAIQMIAPSVGLAPHDVLAALQTGNFNAFAAPGSGWTHIDLIESGALRDRLIRQALAYATPRQRIVVDQFSGLASPAAADQPPTSIYFDPGIAGRLPYDPVQTAKLLTRRGYRRVHGRWLTSGRVLAIRLWTDTTCSDCVAIARRVASSWTAAGIPTTLAAVPTQELFGLHGPLYAANRLASAQLNAVLYTWQTTGEPDDSFYWSSDMIVRPGHLDGGNFDGYSSTRVDQLEQLALGTASEARRITYYRGIQSVLVDDQPDIFLYWTADLTLAVTALHGYQANPFHPGVTWNAADWSLH